MKIFGDIWLLRPYWALGVFLMLGIYALYQVGKRRGLGRWRNIMDAPMRQFAQSHGLFKSADRGAIIPLIIATLALIALALMSPARRDENAVTFRNVNILALAIDMSNSVTEGGAVEQVKFAAKRILDQSAGRPVALDLFAGQSYLVAAPSFEPENIASVLSVLDENVMPDQGSRPDRALQDLHEMLKISNAQNADIVLISDGGGVGAEAKYEAEILHREAGARVYALYSPAPNPAYGAPPENREGLAEMARLGGGEIADIDHVEDLIKSLQASSNRTPRKASENSLIFSQYGRWLLCLALPFLLLLFRRRVAS